MSLVVVVVFPGVYLARSSRRWLSISLFLVATSSSYLYMQIAYGKCACDRVSEGIPHANRSLTAAPFFVLGCAVIAVVMTPRLKFLAAVCFVVGGVFFGSYLRDYFTEFPVRADAAFSSEIRREGERAQETGDFAGFYAQLPRFINMYGPTTDRAFVYFEAAGSGRGCPGYR